MSIVKFFSRLFYRWRWIQLEITSFCNGRCLYCPHRVYSSSWRPVHFPFEKFSSLLKDFYSTRMIHLQGWGEPFLHPRFFDFLRLAKKDGLLVGTTTNGTLWNEDLVRRLVEEGLDLVAFSLAGVEKKNDAIREGTSFKKVLWCIETLKKHKDLNNTSSPYIHIAYMWLKSALEDLLKLPDYLKDLGVRQIVVHTLTFVPSSELQSEVIYFEEEVLKLAREAMYRARDLGMEMRIYLPCRDYYAERCPEDIACTLFISSSGEVAPCVLLYLPVKEGLSYFFEGKEVPYHPLSFGSVYQNSLKEIWQKSSYKGFRENFKTYFPCQNCYKPLLKEVQFEEESSKQAPNWVNSL